MFWAGLAACLALGAAAAEISGVTVRQRWPWSPLVDIDYVLTNVTQPMDIAVTARNGVNPVALPDHSLAGDRFGVSEDGAHRIVWDPTVTDCTNQGVLAQFNVTLTPTAVPLYMIVDLTKDAGADGQIEYVHEEDLTNGVWGAWMRNPITNELGEAIVESVVWTGVATNDLYKTDKLVLRRVPAGAYTMGGQGVTAYAMNLTKGMYAGVFEVTQKQWNLVMGTTGGTDAQAKHTVSYDDIRGATNSTPAIDWPATVYTVASGSFMDKLRDKTGLTDFDLPTEAQWEYVCRAKTATVFNDGNAAAKYDGTEENNNGNTNGFLNALGWYKFNDPTPPTAAQPVGGKLPNAWGLYDTHGNVWEWCLDWYGTPVSGSDPKGTVSGSNRVIRGGSWCYPASHCRSAYRSISTPSYRSNNIGFRLVRTLP